MPFLKSRWGNFLAGKINYLYSLPCALEISLLGSPRVAQQHCQDLFTEPYSVWSSKELMCCWVQPASSAQGQRKHEERWDLLQGSCACHDVGSSVLAPGQPLLGELASVFFKPKHMISFLNLPPNQIQCLND